MYVIYQLLIYINITLTVDQINRRTLQPIPMKNNTLQSNGITMITVIGALILLFNLSAKAQESPVIADGAKLTMVSDQFSFTEGPAADKAGNVFFTDQPNNKIWEYSADGKLSLFMDHAGRSNGMFFDNDGNLITCADEHDELWSISPQKKITVLVKGFGGHRLNGPNDVWVDLNGGIYFTDPYYQRKYWKRTKPDIKQQRVYYLTPDKKNVFIVVNDMKKPNGIVGTPNGKALYIADIGAGKTYSYSIKTDGRLYNKKLYTNMGSDGMTIDNEGDIYLTGQGVTIFNKNGKQIGHVPVKQNWTANVTFGGPDHQTLFITASPAIYTLKMKVKGAR